MEALQHEANLIIRLRFLMQSWMGIGAFTRNFEQAEYGVI